MLNYKQSPIALQTLNRFDPSHVLLVDFLLKEALHNQISLVPGAICIEDVIYIYLIQTKENRWLFIIAPTTLPEIKGDKPYKYRTVKALTIKDLLRIAENESIRHKMIESLLPVGITSISYHDIDKEVNMEHN